MRVPTRSAGTRSGVNWMRLKLPRTVRASVLTVSVLASPGTPSTSRWPCASMRHQHALQEAVLADDDALDLVEHALHQRGGGFGLVVSCGCPAGVGSGVAKPWRGTGFAGPVPGPRWGVASDSELAGQSQNGGMPAAVAAFSIGTAKPMPMKVRCSRRVEDGGDDADHLAVHRHQRTAGVAGVGGGVELDQVGQRLLALRASGTRASAPRPRRS